MKRRMMLLGAVLMAGTMLFGGLGNTVVHASPLQAGISATLAECMEQEEAATATTEKKESDQVKASEEQAAEEKTIYGYENLGIAKVDNYLNVRKSADESGEVVGRMAKNTACEILKEKGDWYKIQSGDVKGYVKSEYIATGQKAEKLAKKTVKTIATVNTETLYVREEPNTVCSILKSVTTGDELEVEKNGKKWVEVQLDDESGYVSAKYVDVEKTLDTAQTIEEIKASEEAEESTEESGTASSAGSSVVQTALSYVGGRYVWGGTSLTNGVDCSGFTMQIMAKYGVYLPHSSRAQAGCGRSVSTSELQPGDLIFYGSGSVSHVAIYIGGGQIVHASNSRDGIKVSNAFYRTPICCRRVL